MRGGVIVVLKSWLYADALLVSCGSAGQTNELTSIIMCLSITKNPSLILQLTLYILFLKRANGGLCI